MYFLTCVASDPVRRTVPHSVAVRKKVGVAAGKLEQEQKMTKQGVVGRGRNLHGISCKMFSATDRWAYVP